MPAARGTRIAVALCGTLLAGVLVPSTATVGEESKLYGTEWLAEDIQQRGVIDNLETTLSIDDEGRVSGLAGCNRYSGRVTLEGTRLSFSPFASTRMACLPAVDEQELRFFEALSQSAGYRRDETGMTFFDDAGVEVLRFSEMK